MSHSFITRPSDLPKYKRHISFFENKFTQVCTGINLEATCSNPNCQSVRDLGGLVIVKFPGVKSCVYQEAVPHLRCPSCGSELQSDRVKGVVFVRCEARIDIGVESVVFRVRGEETVLWELPYQGSEVSITILDRDPESKIASESKEFLYPGDGVNLSAVCRNNQCQASITNNGLVVIRVGQVESQTYRELLNNRSCPSCNYPLEPQCFHGIIFNSCKGEVEISGNIQRFNALQMPKLFKIDLSESIAIIRMRKNINDIHADHNITEISNDRTVAMKRGGDKFYVSTCYGINFEARCSNEKCSAYKENDGFVIIMSGHMMSCDYRAAIQTLACPFCNMSIPPTSFLGVALVRCRGEIHIGLEKKVFHSKGDDVQKIPISYGSTRVKIVLYTKESYQSPLVPRTDSGSGNRDFSKVADGINLLTTCKNPSCQASITNNGFAVIKAGRIESQTSRELVSNRSCPSCNHPIEPRSIGSIIFVNCYGEVKIAGDLQEFDANKIPKMCNVDLSNPNVIIRIRQTTVGIRFVPNNSKQTVGHGPSKPSSSKRADGLSMLEQLLVGAKGKQLHLQSTPGLNLVAKCFNVRCASKGNKHSVIHIGIGSANRLRYKDAIIGQNCPSCHQPVPLNNFEGVLFFQCRAKVVICGEETEYVAGRIPEICRLSLEGVEVEITVLERRKKVTLIQV